MSTHAIHYDVPEKCKICGIIKTKYDSSKGSYYGEKFENHLKKHNITVIQYLHEFDYKTPKCCCGCGNYIPPRLGAKITFGKMIAHHKIWNKGLNKYNNKIIAGYSKRMAGKNNPMYGKDAWNKGLTKDDDCRILAMSNKAIGRKISKESRIKMSNAAIQRFKFSKHPMQGKHHSKKTRKRLRNLAIQQMIDGQKKETWIEIKFRKFLIKKKIKFIQQKHYGNYVFDFEIEMKYGKFLIEVHGDYWHANPKIYDRSKQLYDVQYRNIARDKAKEDIVKRSKRHIGLIVLWENEFEEKIYRRKFWLRYKKLLTSRELVK